MYIYITSQHGYHSFKQFIHIAEKGGMMYRYIYIFSSDSKYIYN
jgi:hypothetical protein